MGIKEELTQIPHPDRVLFPDAGITRRDLLGYYLRVSSGLLAHAEDRLLTVKRWPHGITGPMFYQRHPEPGQDIVLQSVRDVLHWVGLGVIEWHAPLGTREAPLRHDLAVMDLDPNPPAGWDEVLAVAEVFAHLLDLLLIPFLLKTSGQRGMHFYIAIESENHTDVMAAMGRLAAMVVDTIPGQATVARLKKDRGSRVYLDYLQNGYARTTALAYTVRATPDATVSAPIRREEWDFEPTHWTMARVAKRLENLGDLFHWSGPRVPLLERLAEKGIWPT